MAEDDRSGARGASAIKTLISNTALPAQVLADLEREELGPEWSRQVVLVVDRMGNPALGLEPERRPLLDHQLRALDALSRWWTRGASSGVLCLPTGAGKTRTAATFALRHALASGPVLWLAHREELVSQAVCSLARCAAEAGRPIRIGRYQAGNRKVDRPVDVVVGSVPTLAAGEDAVDKLVALHRGNLSLVVVDECHHAVARTWNAVLIRLRERVPGHRVLGLSATPTRTSEREDRALASLLGDIVFEQPALELIHRGVLARPRFVVVDTHRHFQASTAEQTEFARTGELPMTVVSRIARDEARNTQIFNTYSQAAAEWGPTLVFVATLEQADRFVHELHAQEIPAAQIRGDAPAADRRRLLAQFAEGRLYALVNVGVLTEGTDLPSVKTVFIARPTRSRVLFAQMAGRAMRGRHAGGNAECNIVSFHEVVAGLGAQPYATSFTEERSAWEAVVGTPYEQQQGETRAGRSAEGGGHARPLPGFAPGLGAPAGPTVDVPLLGWWEVTSDSEAMRLPVFGPDASIIAAWVTSLCRAPLPDARFTTGRRLRAFARAMGRSSDAHFVQLGTDARASELKAEFVTELLEDEDAIPYVDQNDVELVESSAGEPSSPVATDASAGAVARDPVATFAGVLSLVAPHERLRALQVAYPMFADRYATVADLAAAVERLLPTAAVDAGTLPADDDRILLAIAESPEAVPTRTLVRQLRLDEDRWRRAIRRLVDAGWVERVGHARGTRYRITGAGLAQLASSSPPGS